MSPGSEDQKVTEGNPGELSRHKIRIRDLAKEIEEKSKCLENEQLVRLRAVAEAANHFMGLINKKGPDSYTEWYFDQWKPAEARLEAALVLAGYEIRVEISPN